MSQAISYRSSWSYTANQAYTYLKAFTLVNEGNPVFIRKPRKVKNLANHESMVRAALQYHRDHGAFIDLQMIIRHGDGGLLLQPVTTLYGKPVYGDAHVIQDASGRELWQHSPPLPGMNAKGETSSHSVNSSHKIRGRARKKKDHLFQEGDGI